MTTGSPRSLEGVRVAVVQPLLAKYRVPVFDLLARSTGIELTVLCDTKPKGSLASVPPTDAFRCEHAPLRELGPFVSHPAMLSAARSKRFDAVVLTWNARLLQLAPALLACRAGGRASVLWGHGYSKQDSPARRWVRRRLVPMADAIMVYGNAERERLLGAGFERVHVAPNAIDQQPIAEAAARWLADHEGLESWRRAEGVTDGRLVVFISRIEPDKNVELLLSAFRLALGQANDLRLAVIGGGSELGLAKRRASELGVAGRVTFTGPLYSEERIAPWCLSAGCFAYPEAIGLSIQHAFGYGLPVVTGDHLSSHNPEIESLVPGFNGLTFAHRDPDAFARAMLEVLEGPRSRSQWAAAAKATVSPEGGFGLDAMVRGIAETLQAAIGQVDQR